MITPLWKSNVPAANSLIQHLTTICSELQAELKLAQESSKQYVDAHCTTAPALHPGNLVMLLRRDIKTTCPSEKFDYRKIGPFKVLKAIGPNTYQLKLPLAFSWLHPVFNISLLEPYSLPADFPDWISPPSSVPEVVLEGEIDLNIKEILDMWKVGWCFNYLLDFVDQSILDCQGMSQLRLHPN